ncbi:HEPN domain-containing protein [Vibrio natriegens]|uniref:HEPN domain-containing protein n=1 Tax=Vibrio natriegens TaxID=691 RepID=UPI000803EDDE|nr:HEPN domain-containing protein [Vibrio natriegens]ANQ19417.1 hypothetical protein BA891_19800 [Vibrio natriegens]
MNQSLVDLKAAVEIIKKHAKGEFQPHIFDSTRCVELKVEDETVLICYGLDGERLFRKIFNRHIRESLKDYENDHTLFIEMINKFVKKIVFNNGEISERHIKQVCDSIKSKISKSFKKYSIYVPILFFDVEENSELIYGPITIYGRKHEKMLSVSEQDISISKKYNAIARIDIECISKTFAYERSERILQAFFTVSHLNVGLGFNHNTFSYYERYQLGKSYKFYSDDNKKIYNDTNFKFGTPSVDGWQDILTSSLGNILKEVLVYMAHAKNDDIFAIRIFDALVLVRESVNEKYRYNQLTKLVTAIERLILTKGNNDKITPKLAKRITMLANIHEETKCLNDIDFVDLYDIRSSITHGSRSIAHIIDKQVMLNLMNIVNHLIQSCTCLYSVNKLLFTRVSDKRLDKLFTLLDEHQTNKGISYENI